MSADSAGQASYTSPSALASSFSLRKERGAIAAQACDTCRSRKQRCDEKRPKCSTCQKFRLECNYREPQPTKKDRTLVEILDRIKSLEGKIDSLGMRVEYPSSTTTAYGPPHQHESTLAPTSSILTTPPFHLPEPSSPTSGGDENYRYVSSVHQMLAWPAMQQLLAAVQPKVPNLDLSSIERDGPAAMLGLHPPVGQGLLVNTSLASLAILPAVNMPASTPLSISGPNWDTMMRLSKAYFDTFNLFFPILDRQSFESDMVPSAFNQGFSQNMASTIAFLVFALGEVALAASDGLPVHVHNGRSSGVKGGSKNEPPGLDYFNEARKRMGFNLTECSLENVQIFALTSIYYGTCFHTMDFWRMTTFASLACQALVVSNPGELSSPRADLIRRIFWHCSIMETSMNLELGLSLTGLDKLESVVGLPDFSASYSDVDYINNQESHCQEYLISQIVLRRLVVNFHGVLSQTSAFPLSGPTPTPFSPTTASGEMGVSRHMIHQLTLQLDQWRGMLPAQLRWQEDSPGAFPNAISETYIGIGGGDGGDSLYSSDPSSSTSSGISTSAQQQQVGGASSSGLAASAVPAAPLMFTTDLDAPPVRYSFGLDVQVALLRTRYYYTKYLVHRPFMYKALHFPDAVTHDDALGVAECLKASLKWPVAMSPTCTHKRLIPCNFFFTRNLFGILVLLHLSTTVPILIRIRSTLCGERFEMDAGETVGLYLDWLRDLHAMDDGTAGWHWDIVRAIYGLED
ncbi:hypothetical protein B0T26DRAFT_707804 [Lasiosphaeria miniovina]|uniref:Zn(2)-C6 fungal-type domain-containing protein n=1 Tax=Lasiosphaeria miniovina TaxID=1954250 RepID=A0AA40AJG5_9PEZI|nr:uncharacterized protein B0T26DRAFT_707804 [Lasiosphaeria miniovina]KAK0716954.1 hypothetical protein B0T26DRAFT_707804 [Lasiosphaeria miniovina]